MKGYITPIKKHGEVIYKVLDYDALKGVIKARLIQGNQEKKIGEIVFLKRPENFEQYTNPNEALYNVYDKFTPILIDTIEYRFTKDITRNDCKSIIDEWIRSDLSIKDFLLGEGYIK